MKYFETIQTILDKKCRTLIIVFRHFDPWKTMTRDIFDILEKD